MGSKADKFYFNNFLSATEKQTGNYDETSTPLIAKYARVLITPNDDDEIKWYEVNGYSRQLNIEVNKEQNFELINYFVVDEEKKNFMCSDSGEVGTEIKFLESDAYGVAKPIKCSGIKSFKFVFDEDSYVDDVVSYFYFTSNKLSITSGRITGDGLEFIVEVPNNAEYLYVNYLLGHEFTINQYS